MEPEEMTEDEALATLDQMIDGFMGTQYVALAARLGIADLLARGPVASDELAEATRSHPDALYRALRALASRGLFIESEGRRSSRWCLASPTVRRLVL